jgi:signal transduction histidine kinase/FixJ family two-component response regulator
MPDTDIPLSASGARTVLLVDDSAYWTETLADGLRREGYVVSVLHDGLTAVERLRKEPPNILITDFFLANLDGGKLCQLAKKAPVDPPITTIILTGGADRKHSRAPSLFADAVIAKNAAHIVFDDLRRALAELKGRTKGARATSVIGHERLEPRMIASKLHGLKQYLDALHEGIGDAVIGVDPRLRVYFLNSVAIDLFDLDEQSALARPVEHVLGVPADHALILRIKDALMTSGPPRRPITVERDGLTLRVTVAGLMSPDGQATAVVIARDISDLKAAEQARLALDARLHESDKMASLGHLVAGVSHEINNPLAAILPNFLVLQEDFTEILRHCHATQIDDKLRAVLDEVPRVLEESRDAIERIRSIVAEMRVFAYPNSSNGEPSRIERILEGPLTLVTNQLRPKARIERVFGETPELVVDRNRLGQAFLNIVLNAAQAIDTNEPERNYIRIVTRAEAEGVVIEISNNGPPIPRDILPKIFEPFFTTKPVGEGLGLGLSISYDTVRRHGGTIEVTSSEGEPTRFRIWLPRNTGLALAPRPPRSESGTTPSARVLVVDDDRLVRNSLRRILERHHEVVVASGGQRALELLLQERFDVVICDLIMPGMTGQELFEEVKRRLPTQSARFVFLTGGTSSADARDFLLGVENPRAYKPVSAEEIVRLVARCLRQFSAAASGEPRPED